MIPAEIRKTIEAALRRAHLHIEMSDLDENHEARELARIDAPTPPDAYDEVWEIATLRHRVQTLTIERDALQAELAQVQPVVTDYEREMIEAMIDDIKSRHQAGTRQWVRATAIEAWLGNYSGTMCEELADAWPSLPALDGVDMFAHLGKPTGEE